MEQGDLNIYPKNTIVYHIWSTVPLVKTLV